MELFKLRGELTKNQSWILGVIGFMLFILFWWVMAESLSKEKPIIEGYETQLPSSISGEHNIDLDSLARADSLAFANATEYEIVYPNLPPPQRVAGSFGSLISDDNLVSNMIQSIWINIQGYLWAVLIAIPLGFLIGLIPLFRGLFSRQVDAIRFLPLSALVGLFVAWFGIYNGMKVAFLAFGILVYLLPVIVQRIYEVEDVYLKTVFTLNANNWQTIKSVYLPSVMSKVMDDMRVLTAISWTYIIIAELVNRQGGIGSLIFIKARQGQLEKVFAILIIIILIGFFQDQVFKLIDRTLFPYKNYKSMRPGLNEAKLGTKLWLGVLALAVAANSLFDLPTVSLSGFSLSTLFLLIIVVGVIFMIYGIVVGYTKKKEVNA